MKKIFTLLFIISGNALLAQQSLFNVASVSVTKKKEAFFQEQANITKDGTVVNFNSAYGLGHDFEVGLNLVGMGIQTSKDGANLLTYYNTTRQLPYSPLVMATLLKAFHLTNYFCIGVGTQFGLNPLEGKIHKNGVANFNYANARFEIPKTKLILVAGGYYSNRVYIGQGDLYGPMCGFEYAVIDHKFLLMGDWIIGKNSISVLVPGFVYHPHHNVALSLGYQIPSPGSENPQGLVFELTLGNFSSK